MPEIPGNENERETHLTGGPLTYADWLRLESVLSDDVWDCRCREFDELADKGEETLERVRLAIRLYEREEDRLGEGGRS